jgi:hypothetical protein
MYLRYSTVRKNGKSHKYWRLVRSVRRGSQVRQETVAHLGELDAAGRAKASALARHFLGRKTAQLEFFDEAPTAPMPVRLDQVRVERSRSFGDVWLGWVLWKTLGLDDFCHDAFPAGRETVSWADTAAILAIARLCEPSSELHIAEDWYRRTALEDLLGVASDRVEETRLYRALDRLLPHKRALESHLKQRFGELFALDYDLLLYDVTSTYFEGEASRNLQAQRGYSRDSRPDCKQVCIGLVVTRDGYPLGYEVFDGNRVDVTTVEEIVEEMEKRHGKAGRIWVMDRGMVSEDNLQWLREGQRRYLVGTPKSELKKWERELVDRDGWQDVRDGLEVKICPTGVARPSARASAQGRQPLPGGAADRPDAGAQPARRRRLPDPGQEGRQASVGPAAPLEPQGGVERVGAAHRGHLHPALQRDRLERGRAVAHLHPAQRGGGRLPDPEERSEDPPDLAPARGSRPGPHPGLLPGVCALEDVGGLAEAGRTRLESPHRARGDASHRKCGRRAAARKRSRDATAVRRAPGQGAGRPA